MFIIPNKFHSSRSSREGFSLVEVIIGVVIISLISVASWMAFSVLMDSAETSRTRSIAVNLLQKSQEEIKQVARSFYDTLETCQFPQNATDVDPCGLSFNTATASEFTRSAFITQEQGTELKKAEITVSWSKFGIPKQLRSVVFIARPPDPLPGNIKGRVMPTGQPGTIINGASITVTGAFARTTTSNNSPDAEGDNFNFDQAGQFVLPAGPWKIQATHPQYFNYPRTGVVTTTVLENETKQIEIFMDPRPQDAVIHGQILRTAGNPVANFSGGRINLYEDGGFVKRVSNGPVYSFTIPFTDPSEQRCFTVNTQFAFKSRLAYQVNSGGAPSCIYNYNPQGWSSAVMPLAPAEPLLCSQAWNGGPDSGSYDPDRICVESGDVKQQNISLGPVPTATLIGRVVDNQSSTGIEGATVYVDWPSATAGSHHWGGTRTGPGGVFSMAVPAVQEMFPDGTPSGYHLKVWADWVGPVTDCCGVTTTETRTSPKKYNPNPLYLGSTDDVGDLVIPVDERVKDCGDIEGIIDDPSTGGLSGANVTIYGSESTDGSGYYAFKCDPAQGGFRVPVRNYRFRASRGGYYQNDSYGNFWYSQRGSDVGVKKDTTITYNAPLWPRKYGTIRVDVTDLGSGNPVPNASVKLIPYFGSSRLGVTNSSGQATFSGVPETWPPSTLPAGNSYYRHNVRRHTVEVTHNSGLYEPKSVPTGALNDGDTLVVPIGLIPKGNM